MSEQEDKVRALAEIFKRMAVVIEYGYPPYHTQAGGLNDVSANTLARVAIAKLAEMDAAEVEAQDGGKRLNCEDKSDWCPRCRGTGDVNHENKGTLINPNGPPNSPRSFTLEHRHCPECGGTGRRKPDAPEPGDAPDAGREAEIAERAKAATPGPKCNYHGEIHYLVIGENGEETGECRSFNITKADLDFMAAAYEDIPYLLDQLAAARAEALMWRNGCKGLREERDATEAALNRIVKGYKRITKDNDDLRARLDSTGECLDNVVQDYRTAMAKLARIRKAAEPIQRFIDKSNPVFDCRRAIHMRRDGEIISGFSVAVLRTLVNAIKEEL